MFPKLDIAALRLQLNRSKYKSVQCKFADPVFLALDPFAGAAKVQADLKRVYEHTVGSSEPPAEQIVTMTVSRSDPRSRWSIDTATYKTKPK